MNEDNILKEQGTPLTGTPRYTPGASGFGLKDPEGNAVGSTWYSIETPTPSVADQGARIGDYVLQKGKATVIPNSPTDLSQRYKIAIGGTSAPANTVSIANEGTGAVAGATIGAASLAIGGPIGMAVGGLVGGLAGALNAHNTAAEEALKNWQEENIKYDSAVTFYRDDNGALKYDIDYQKMGTGGARSGEAVKEAQNRETKVELGDDGRLKINVSPIFASTARFNELVNWISENYAGLNKDTENLDTILNEIQNGIDGEAQSFVTNMKLYADYANRFPEASPEAIVSAYMTEAAGYVNPDEMSDFQMTIVGDNGLETKSASEFFDSVLGMDKDGRNTLLEKLNEIVFGDNDYSANDKAVAYGEIKALYAVSSNLEKYDNSKYQGMLDGDPFVTFWYSFAPLGLNAGDALNFVSGGNLMKSKQEFLNQNDFAKFIGSAGGIAAGFGLWKAGTSLVEKGLKMLPGTSKLFNLSLEGQEGGVLAFFAQNTGNSKTVLKAASASAAFKTLKVGVFDAALSGSKVLVSDEDFWTEFGRDFTRDALLEAVFSYYDLIQFTKGVNDSTVYVYRDPKTGNIQQVPSVEAEGVIDDSLDVVGAYNVQKTRAGEEAGIIQSDRGTTYYYNGTAVTVSPSGEVQKLLTSPEATTDGVPAFKTGVTEPVGSVKTQEIELEKTLERAGFSKDAEIFEMPATDAAAAQVAGKIAKFDTSKAGLAINKYLFNKNAALDTVNELALAKTGDRTAWQNRSEKFVDISRNAEQEISLMQIGYYVKSSEQAFADYDNVLGKLNLTSSYTKRDANYLKALRGLEMASYLDRTKVKDDPRNYTAEALEKYGEAIAKIPNDRAMALKEFQDVRKARHDATKASAKKSKKIDIKKLENVMGSDIQKEIGWVPQWGKKTTYRGLLDEYNAIPMERNIYKEWLPDGQWVDLDKLEDPLEADRRFLEFVTTNMGTTDMMTATADALSDAGLLIDNTPTSETVRKKKLESIKNKDELKNKLTEMIDAKKNEVEEKVLSQKQYKDLMEKTVEESGILEDIQDVINVDDIKRLKRYINDKKKEIVERSPKEDAQKIIPNLSYKERKDLAKSVVRNNPDDYMLLYRVQGGKPDKWRPNNRGKKGKFEGKVGEYKGYVWLTSDADWAEGPQRASAGVERSGISGGEKVTNENIVVLPVKKADIKNLSMEGEAAAMRALEDGQKIVQSRVNSIEHGTEFILNGERNPEIFKEGMDLMLKEYNKQFSNRYNQKAIRNILNDIEISKKELENLRQGKTLGPKVEMVINSSKKLLNEVNKYNKTFGYDFDVTSYMNTEYLPNLKEAINAKNMAMASGIINQAILDVAPYQSRSEVMKSQQDIVAEEWREWAEKHIKAGRASNKELKKFVDDNDLKLPDDKRPLPNKIKHALWEMAQSGKKLPKIEGLDTSKISKSSLKKGSSGTVSMADEKYKQLLKKAKNYKTLDRFEKMNNPIKGSEVWGEKPTSTFQRDSRAIRVNMFPNDAVKGAGITKQYLLNLFKDAYEQGVTDIFPSYGSYTKEGTSFMDHLVEQGWLSVSKGSSGYKSYSVAPKIKEWERTNPLADIYNEAHNKASASSDPAKEDFYKALDETPLFQSATKDKKELVDLVAAEINGETTDAYKMGAASTAAGLGNSYPFTWIRNGKPYTRFIITDAEWKRRLAENITEIFSDKQIIKQPGIVSKTASTIANDFRLLTTSFDPTRGPLNFSRDTIRGQITSGGQSLIQPTKVFKSWIENGNYTEAEKERLSKALDNVANMVAGETYNAAYRTPRKAKVQATKNYLSNTGAHPLRRFTYNLFHDPRSILEFPTNFFEGVVRRRLARSAAVIKLRQLQEEGASFKEQLEGMVDAATFAGREYTANFQRKGKLIGATSKYIAYQSTTYAGFEGIKRAFINNPEGVSKNFAVFLILYTILLADTLGDEDSRRNYYRLSDYDRGNSLVLSLDDNTVLTIPLDQEVASLLFPYRRVIETLNGVDPVSFFEFIWGTLTEPMPFDLSGFSEGEGFNLTRGLEKLTAQNLPNLLAGIQEAATGYDLYYGSDLSVTDDTLKDYGIYNPEAGDYTTASNDSLVLRQIANATGIPQWQLQAMVSNYGGNVGSYILNIIDKLGGATEEQQGGKDFANAIFKSFVATDQDAAAQAFYSGVKQLQQEKRKVVQQIANYNEDIKTATGAAKVELQNKLQKAKDDFAVKVGDFVDKYVSAYEITGGLSKSQAMQVYYLFRFDDDDTVYEQGSTEEYYNNKALQQFKNRATAMSAPILDRYYNNRLGNIYQDADGNWQHYLSSGMQAMRNSIYGQSEEHMVNLLNILEGKDSDMKSLRSEVRSARNEAYEKKDYTTRDKIGYEFDKKVIEAISPYIEKYGAENVLGSNEVLDYLSDWFFVPDSFKKTKRGGYVSLGNSGQTEEAFVRPYIKYVFGLPTNYYSYSEAKLTSPSLGDFGR